MADFKTHMFVSTTLGVGYGFTAYAVYEMPVPTCLLASGLCSVAGMLPDIDSNSGRPLKESLAFGAAFVPMMLAMQLRSIGFVPEAVVLICAIGYLLIRFGLGACLKKFTRHRGMFHSIPAAIIFGELTFLLATGDTVAVRAFKAFAVIFGFISHLVLDELYSIETKKGRVRAKSSLGTAFKFFSPKSWGSTILTYAILAVLTYVTANEPNWMRDAQSRHRDALLQQLIREEQETTTPPSPASDGAPLSLPSPPGY
jgi:hypothetical protein